MEIDLPDVVAEVSAAFDRYEKALVTNDVPMLDELFRDDPRTVRYGATEILYGYDEIKSFRAARSPVALGRKISRTVITTFGRDFAVASTLYERARQNRTANANLGKISGGLARGGRSRQPDGQAGRRLERRHSLYFDQQRFLYKPVDHQQRVGWIGPVRKHFRKFTQAVLHEFRNILRVNQVSRELHDISPAGADRFQCGLDIGKGLHALGVEIVDAHDLAVPIDTHLTCDEDEFRGLHAGEMRILPQWLAERVRVENLDVSHL
jgi:hypothetical protein